MIADSLDHRDRATVAHRETLAGRPSHVEFAAARAVEDGVADQDRPAAERRFRQRVAWGGADRDQPARHALADVVVRFAGQVQGETIDAERPEALPGGPGQ